MHAERAVGCVGCHSMQDFENCQEFVARLTDFGPWRLL